jgi:hypothetical protein
LWCDAIDGQASGDNSGVGRHDAVRPRGTLIRSRAKGSPKPTSDIDLAITVDGNTAGTILGNWYVEGKRWQPQLTTLLGSKAYLDLYNDPDGDKVRRYCDEYSVLLFPLKRTPLKRG